MDSLHGALAAEEALFERLLYKNSNQHRRAVFFRKLQAVRRCNRRLLAAQCRTDDERVAVARAVRAALEAVGKAAPLMMGLLAQSYFMPFALTVLAMLARFFSIHTERMRQLALWFRDDASLAARYADDLWLLRTDHHWLTPPQEDTAPPPTANGDGGGGGGGGEGRVGGVVVADPGTSDEDDAEEEDEERGRDGSGKRPLDAVVEGSVEKKARTGAVGVVECEGPEKEQPHHKHKKMTKKKKEKKKKRKKKKKLPSDKSIDDIFSVIL